MATKASAVFGRYGTRPLDLHGDWYTKVSFYARLVGMDLIAHCKDPGDLRLPVSSDWRETLCGKLAVPGADRRNARGAMDALVKAGFLHHEGAWARISLEPEMLHSGSTPDPVAIHSGSTSVPLPFQSGSTSDPLPSQPSEIIEPEASSREEGRKEREGESEPAPEIFIPERRPVGEPPPGFVDTYQEAPKPLPLHDQILTAWKRAVGDKLGKTPGSTKRVADSAAEIAEWLGENVEEEDESPLEAFQVALKQYVSDEKLRAHAWPLNWLLDRMPGYLADKQPETPAPKSNNPTHQVWKAPDYAAEQRESEARYLRQREEWFAQHPELRAEAEEAERELAAQAAQARVVVSITEAPKPPRAVRTAEDLEARKRFLQEQAKQLLAAKAAQ